MQTSEIKQEMTEGKIDGHKRAEESLRESVGKLELLCEILPVGVSVLDKNRRIILHNKALENIVGISSEGLARGDYRNRRYLRADGTPMPEEEFAGTRVINGEAAVHNVEIGVVKEDGSIVWTNVSAAACHFADWSVVLITSDITRRKEAEERSVRSEEQLRAFSSRSESLREQDRTLISRDIHDKLGQMLTASKMDLRWLEKELPKIGDESLRNSLHEKISSAVRLDDEMLEFTQKIATELRPGVLDLGLCPALRGEAQQFEKRTGISCAPHLSGEDVHIDPAISTAVFRICQEIITNVARHANATQVEMHLQVVDKDWLLLEVKDNGKGISQEEISNPKSLGLLGMRERVAMAGGELFIQGKPGEGTTVKLRMPRLINKSGGGEGIS